MAICLDGAAGAVTGLRGAELCPDVVDAAVHFCFEARAHPDVVPRGRHCARHMLAAWQVDQLACDAELVISELLTNAVRATLTAVPLPGARAATAPRVTLCLTLTADLLTVLVMDGCPDPPIRRANAGHEDENGRGLVIVQAIAEDWGIRPVAGGGKIVWAQLGLGPARC